MNQKRFAPLVVQEEIVEEVIETRLVEEAGDIQLVSSYSEFVEPGTNSNANISVYLELLNEWKKLALEELRNILEDYAQTTKQFQILQSYNPRSPPSWLVLDYSIDTAYDENDEFASKFEAAKKEFLRKAVELDSKATQKKLLALSKYLQDPTLICQNVYTQSIAPKVQSLPSNLKESWDSAKKRCEYAYSQDATALLESKLKEIEKIAKEPIAALNQPGFRPTPPRGANGVTSTANPTTGYSSSAPNTPNRTANNTNTNSNATSVSNASGASKTVGGPKQLSVSTPSKLPSSPSISNAASPLKSPKTDKVIVTTNQATKSLPNSGVHSPISKPSANSASPTSQGSTTPSSPIDPNDRHRPSTRGKGRARVGQQEDISHLLNSLSNL